MKDYRMIPIGTRIKFRRDIFESATGDHPEFILARKGEPGTIVDHVKSDKEYPYRVTWDGWPHSFAACDADFTKAD